MRRCRCGQSCEDGSYRWRRGDGRTYSLRSNSVPSPLWNQPPHRDHIDQIQQRQQRDRRLEPMSHGHRRDRNRAKPTDRASNIEQHVLCRRSRFGRIQFAHQRAIATEHSVNEEAHHPAAHQQDARRCQPGIYDHHDRSPKHIAQEGGAPANTVRRSGRTRKYPPPCPGSSRRSIRRIGSARNRTGSRDSSAARS